ncbi:MAG: hypothetical protein Q7K57_14830 [Burkholderiaceae bacterium]|nr:hypothetical protein [Burkholderiaceae bacterium]
MAQLPKTKSAKQIVISDSQLFLNSASTEVIAIGRKRLLQLQEAEPQLIRIRELRKQGEYSALLQYVESIGSSPFLIMVLQEQLYAASSGRASKAGYAKNVKMGVLRQRVVLAWDSLDPKPKKSNFSKAWEETFDRERYLDPTVPEISRRQIAEDWLPKTKLKKK